MDAPLTEWSNPFALEVLANPDLLPFERTFVAAHEWAHLAGFADEAEANFVAWLTCVRAGASAQYSGWLSLYWQIGGEADRGRTASVYGTRSPTGPRRDIQAISDRLQRGPAAVPPRASWRVYDGYLRANRVEEGIRSYGQVINLDSSGALRGRLGSRSPDERAFPMRWRYAGGNGSHGRNGGTETDGGSPRQPPSAANRPATLIRCVFFVLFVVLMSFASKVSPCVSVSPCLRVNPCPPSLRFRQSDTKAQQRTHTADVRQQSRVLDEPDPRPGHVRVDDEVIGQIDGDRNPLVRWAPWCRYPQAPAACLR